MSHKLSRRELLRKACFGSGMLAMGPLLWAQSNPASPRNGVPMGMSAKQSNLANLANTMKDVAVSGDPETIMRIPAACQIRLVAKTHVPPSSNSDYKWHPDPDGGACFATDDGGWVYVSNSETKPKGKGGVGAIRFDATGQVIDSYSICQGTHNNCAGGPTPWNTWLSGEEVEDGYIYECDPMGIEPAKKIHALGKFKHEAAAVDPNTGIVYLTEDEPDGCFYRYRPFQHAHNQPTNFEQGQLEVACLKRKLTDDTWQLQWRPLQNGEPNLITEPATRKQVKTAQIFKGGEGCWFHNNIVYFTTKYDNCVWALDVKTQELIRIYDQQRDRHFQPLLDDVDNLTVSAQGDVIVAEDGSNMRMVVFNQDAQPFELVNVQGHTLSEICGPAFSPDGQRLYFSSQQGIKGTADDGRTYELSGPFFV